MLARYLRNKGTDKAPWSDWCRDFEQRYLKKRYGFARVPSPHISAVDVAQMFIERKKFVATNIYFSKCNCVWRLMWIWFGGSHFDPWPMHALFMLNSF